MPQSRLGNPIAAHKVLIAAQDTSFKHKVLTAVVDKLGTTDFNYQVVGLSQLAGQDVAEYGVILIMSPIEGGIIDKRIGSFLEKDPSNPKAIVLYTYGIQSLKDKIKWDYKVDAVSSASVESLAPTVSDQLVAFIKTRF
jgi:hypothetical protein